MSFSENLLQMSRFLKAFCKFSLTFLQIVSSLSANLLKTLSETVCFCQFFDRFRPGNKQNPKKFRALRARGLQRFSANFHMNFCKFQHGFLQILAWFSEFSANYNLLQNPSANVTFFFCKCDFLKIPVCKFHRFLLQFFLQFQRGGNLPLSLWYNYVIRGL